MKYFLSLLLLILMGSASAQSHSHAMGKKMEFPNIPGYITLKTDLHQHTVFSDGNVWPTIRVMEALRDNLDVISLTEHLEYQPHRSDIPHPDRNRSYELALAEAREHDLMIVHGAEITRSSPVGHSNAVFIEDANKLMAKDSLSPFKAAKKQKAFVFWNHPAWYAQSPNGNPILSEFQEERIQKGELHGIEVINTGDYAEESLALALKYKLTILATSDIHGLIDWDYSEKGAKRPITLVFAEEKTQESLKEALFAGRTVAVYNDLWVGQEQYLTPLIQASVQIDQAEYIGKTNILKIELTNTTSSDLLFENAMDYNFYSSSPVFTLVSGERKTLQIKTLERKDSIKLQMRALGAFSAPKTHPVVSWDIALAKE